MTYNIHQQVFGHARAAGIVGNILDTEDNLQSIFEKELPGKLAQVGPNWNIVWGPVVWKNDPDDSSSGPDNSWYIARNSSVQFEDGISYDTYVLAIAGTASSAYDWLQENLNVGTVVDFTAWIKQGIETIPAPAVNPKDATGTYISAGTARGVYVLASQPAPSSAAGAGQTVSSFFQSITPTFKTRLVATGHSLGGALSPTLTLGLSKAGALSSFLPTNVLTYPVAGPSPGNGNFRKLFASTFPASAGSGYQVWNKNIINLLDIVPQAWCTDPSQSPDQNLQNIPGIYGRPIFFVSVAVGIIIACVKGSNILYIPLPNSSFTGARTTNVSTLNEFIGAAAEEHVKEYVKYIGTSIDLAPAFERNKNLTFKSKKQIYYGYPVIGDIAQEGEAAAEREKAEGAASAGSGL